MVIIIAIAISHVLNFGAFLRGDLDQDHSVIQDLFGHGASLKRTDKTMTRVDSSAPYNDADRSWIAESDPAPGRPKETHGDVTLEPAFLGELN